MSNEIRTIMRRLWESACMDQPQRDSVQVQDGHFVLTIATNNGADPGLLSQVSGVPADAEQIIEEDRITLRWPSHADAVFGPGGLLAQHMDNYEVRLPQVHMARLVQRSIEMGEPALIEAGTGTGKGYAYLAIGLAMGKRMVISTSNKNLQMQLYNKDLPVLLQFYPNRTVALAVGKSNYACRYKVEDQEAGRVTIESPDLRDWYFDTESGNTEEIDFAVDWQELAEMTVDDSCGGKHCPLYSSCFYYRAKEQRAEADVVITNHALLCQAYLHPFAKLLPDPDLLVIDEAHTLPDYARRALGAELTMAYVERLRQQAERHGANTDHANDAIAELTQAVTLRMAGEQKSQIELADELPEAQTTGDYLREAANTVWDAGVQPSGAQEQTRATVAKRIRTAADNLRALATPAAGFVRWLEPNNGAPKLVRQPHDVAEFLNSIYGMEGTIFTSATLAAPDMAMFLRTCGLDDALQMQAVSPFDYEQHARLYLPNGSSPTPKDTEWREWAINEMQALVLASQGGAFLLFTSYSMMHRAAQALRRTFESRNWPVLVQGELAKLETARRFGEDGNAVLFATKSFFEGVSIEGSALRLVVVDKMPFEAPSPLNQAMEADLKVYARDTLGMPARRADWYPFEALRAPKMILELKQATGRLIRTRRDYGVMAILDSRIRTASYGRRMVLPALPPAPTTSKLEILDAFYESHRREPGRPLAELPPVEMMAHILRTP